MDKSEVSGSQLAKLFENLSAAESPSDREQINNSIVELFSVVLESPSSFMISLDSLPHVGNIHSEDGLVRIFTWSYSNSPVDHRYTGLIQVLSSDSSEISLHLLNHKADPGRDFESSVFTADDWYGALYYQMFTVTHNEKKYYTLIGFDHNTLFVNRKLVDVLTFENGKPVFGAPLFRMPDGIRHRVSFDYSSRVVMMLRYFSEKDMIIYDHLSPSSPGMTGQFRYYGPDMSYDALRFEGGWWIHKPDIDWR